MRRTTVLVDEELLDRLAVLARREGISLVADRLGEPRLVTLDRRHFSVVRSPSGSSYQLLPA